MDPTPRAFVRSLLAWGRLHRRDFPWRTEHDPFRILIAEVLLQRSRGSTVAGVYHQLWQRWPDPYALSRAQERSIRSVIRPLGLVRRGAIIKALAADIDARGAVPTTVEQLMQLPGVGRYAAHATAAVAFGRRVPTVDGVSARVYRRYFGLSDGLPAVADESLWRLVGEVTPRSAVREWNWAVLDLAAGVCLPRVPRCGECPLATRCAWSQGLSRRSSRS